MNDIGRFLSGTGINTHVDATASPDGNRAGAATPSTEATVTV